jgi:hypothetical protein
MDGPPGSGKGGRLNARSPSRGKRQACPGAAFQRKFSQPLRLQLTVRDFLNLHGVLVTEGSRERQDAAPNHRRCYWKGFGEEKS